MVVEKETRRGSDGTNLRQESGGNVRSGTHKTQNKMKYTFYKKIVVIFLLTEFQEYTSFYSNAVV